MLKRIFAAIAAVCIAFSGIGTVSFAADESSDYVLFLNRDFEDGSSFDGLGIASKSNIIKNDVENGDINGNGFVRFQMSDNKTEDCYIDKYITGYTEQTMVEFDVSYDTKVLSGINLQYKDANGATSYFVTINSDGSIIHNGDNSQIGSVKKDKWTHVAMHIDFKNAKLTTIMQKGKKQEKHEALFSKPDLNSLSLLRFHVNGEAGSGVLIDNLKIYEGSEIRENLKEEDRVRTPRKIQKPVYQTEGEVGSRIFYNRTYEENTTWSLGLNVVKKSNIIELAEEENKNHYIKLEGAEIASGSRDGYLDLNIAQYTRFMVLEADFSYKNALPEVQLFHYKSTDGKSVYLLNVDKNGTVTYRGNAKPIGKLEEGKWLKVSLAIDWVNSSVDVYGNGERLYEGVPLPDIAVDSIGTLRIWMSSLKDFPGATLMVDNWKVYEGKQPRDVKEGETSAAVSIIAENDSNYLQEAEKLGDNAVMLNVDAETIYANKTKKKLDVGAYFQDGRTLVPVRAISEAFGCDVGYDASTMTVSVDGVDTLVIGSNEMKLKDGSTYTLDVAAQVKDGRTFIPLRALGEKLLGKYVKWDEHRLIVITDEEYNDNTVDYTKLNNFMLYDRPDAQELKKMFKNSNQHPRLLLNGLSAQELVNKYNTNEYMKKWGDSIINAAENRLNVMLPKYETPDGLRFGQSYVNGYNLAMAYMLTKDEKFAKRAYEEIETVANFPDWNPGHYLDTAEQAAKVAILYDWLYDVWTAEQREVIETALYKHAVKTAKDIIYGQHAVTGLFFKSKNNWNVICAAGTTLASLAIADLYPDDCFDVISKMIRTQENMLSEFYPDGAWSEGPGYWTYLMSSLPLMYQAVEDNFGTDFNLTRAPGLEKTGYYLPATASAVGQNNFHDADVGTGMPSHGAMLWLSNKYNDPTLTSLRLYLMEKNKTTPTIMDMLFYNTDITSAAPAVQNPDVYFGGVEFVSLRNSWTNDDGTFISFHGGETAVNHYHVDSGTFVIDMLGERWACDIGPEDYNLPEIFGNYRTRYYRNRPEGHNVYVINPQDGGVGQNVEDTFAPVEKTVSSNRGAYSIINLFEPYSKYVTKARRGIKLEDDRRSAVVRDEFVPVTDDSSVYWFMHTQAEIEIIDNNTFVLTKNGKKVKCMIETNGKDAVLSKMDAMPLQWSPESNPNEKDRSTYKKICLNFKASQDTYVQMKMTAYDDYASSEPMENISLDNWTNEEGELAEIPELSMIYADGKPINDFMPSTGSYEIRVPYNVTEPYKITYDNPKGYDVLLSEGKTLSDVTTITVKNTINPKLKRVYTIKYGSIPKLNDIFSMTRHQVFDHSASDVPEVLNQPYNVSDNDNQTRWACTGECWIQLDLGEQKTIDAVAVSYMKGNERRYKFDVLVSNDGETWTKVLENVSSSGTTEDMELYRFEKSYSAKYVRYLGYGSDVNVWNSITEFAALENK